jgi:hypothetical protein
MPDICACPQCKALATPSFSRDGHFFCSQACTDRHPDKQPCPRSDCHCEHVVLEQQDRNTGSHHSPQGHHT